MKQYLNYIGEKLKHLVRFIVKDQKNSAFYDDRYYELADAFLRNILRF